MAVRSRRTRKIRAIIGSMRERRLQPCARCGQWIDYDAAQGEPNAFNAGHIEAWSTHPELREDPANFQPEHETCNKSVGAGKARPGLGLRSREW